MRAQQESQMTERKIQTLAKEGKLGEAHLAQKEP